MDTKLNSGTAQVSDRFIARIATPVVDAGGRTLLPSGAIVEGHVASVRKARWAHRSGELGVSFDYVVLGDGRKIPLRATLISGSNPINEEGDLKAKSSTKRDVLVTTGGAMAGVGIGALTSATVLAGTGVGAAAGLTVVLIMKGKNVDIDPGERFQLELDTYEPHLRRLRRLLWGRSRIRIDERDKEKTDYKAYSLQPRQTSTPRPGGELGLYDDPMRSGRNGRGSLSMTPAPNATAKVC